jgi:phospholipid/cholesterol/gamma-HCH transport system substrate-binding protein
MKNVREIKIALLVIVCGGLLYFGMNYLKGVNLFAPVKYYVGTFENVRELTVQAPVYVRGYKVGQVDKIVYDFTKEKAFDITISVDKHVQVIEGSQMVLVSDGLMGGKAISLEIPAIPVEKDKIYATGSQLPTTVEAGLFDKLENELIAKLNTLLEHADSLVVGIDEQLTGNEIKKTLANVEQISSQLKVSAHDIQKLTHEQLPGVMNGANKAIVGLNDVIRDVKEADIQNTIAKVDTMVGNINTMVTSKEGTLGLLLNDKTMYQNINATIVSADSLITDLKAHPKRYVHFSLFGKKEGK